MTTESPQLSFFQRQIEWIELRVGGHILKKDCDGVSAHQEARLYLWVCPLWHTYNNWDLLTDNVKLEIRQAVSWDPTVDNFLCTDEMLGAAATPDAGVGLKSFLKGISMKEVSELLDCTER